MRLPIILTYRLACNVSKIIGQIFAIDMGVPHFNAPGGDPLQISG